MPLPNLLDRNVQAFYKKANSSAVAFVKQCCTHLARSHLQRYAIGFAGRTVLLVFVLPEQQALTPFEGNWKQSLMMLVVLVKHVERREIEVHSSWLRSRLRAYHAALDEQSRLRSTSRASIAATHLPQQLQADSDVSHRIQYVLLVLHVQTGAPACLYFCCSSTRRHPSHQFRSL